MPRRPLLTHPWEIKRFLNRARYLATKCIVLRWSKSIGAQTRALTARSFPSLKNLAVLEHLFGRGDIARVERAELGVASGCFVEPHLVDDFFKVFGIRGPQCDAPFPIFKSDAHCDELRHSSGEGHAAAGMLDHEVAALLFWQRKPILADFALLVHRVKAGGAERREIGREPLAVHVH